jgi:hypothetical protein
MLPDGHLVIAAEWLADIETLPFRRVADAPSMVRRSGYTLTLFRKGDDGHWRLARDANLLTVRR